MNRKVLLGASAVLLALLLTIYFLFGRGSSDQAGFASKVGTVESIQGRAESRYPRTLDFKPLAPNSDLHSQEVIRTDDGSFVIASLANGTAVRVNEGTRFVVETDATRSDSLIATILEGRVTVLNPGARERIRLFYQGKELTLEEASRLQPSVVTPREAAAPTALVITATSPDENATPAPEATPRTSEEAASSDVLTNEDIVRHLRGQTGFFQRCYLTYIHRARTEKDVGPLSGTVTVSFRVQPNGKVTEAMLVRSDFRDQVLHRCVMEVVERARFKAFQGDTVPVLEFPIKLQ